MSFVAELKQRKVFRVATLYVVVAWIAVQAASIALPAFDAPPWVLRVVILLVALGFPFALVLAWALDMTPQGVRFSAGGTGSRRIALLAAALVLLALGWFFRGQPALRPGNLAATAQMSAAASDRATAVANASGPATDARSVAVLPFLNMSGDPANEYFSDGIAETTLDMLAQVPDLKVVARTSSFAFKGKSDDVRRIGAALGAATVLEGSVQRAGDAVRITTQLVRASDGFHLWSRHFDRQLADVFKIQDEVATEVVRALEVSLPAGDQQRLTQKRTENVGAYQDYLKGIALLPGRKVEDMRTAVAHFERAIILDPDYARAYIAAADTYELLNEYGHISADEKARIGAYISKALALAPELGEAHASRGNELLDSGGVDGAGREYRRAIELAPSYATAFQWYGEMLGFQLHDFTKAEQMLRHAAALDPLSPIVQDQLIYPLINSNRFDAAATELDKLQRDHPDFAQGYYTRARLAAAQGDLVAALRGLRDHAAHDPSAVGRMRGSCFLMLRFSAVEQARQCMQGIAKHLPDASTLNTDLAQAALLDDGAAAVLAQAHAGKPVEKGFEAYLLLCLERNAEALAIFRAESPQLFAEPLTPLYASRIGYQTLAGIALLRGGATAQGRALLQQVIEFNAAHPTNASGSDYAWFDVVALETLGEREKAIAALGQGVDAGVILDIRDLDFEPFLAALRKDPRYEAVMAPARARLAAQFAAAHAAELL